MLALGLTDRSRPKSAAAFVLPGATWHELQSHLRLMVTCAGLRGTQERPSCEPRSNTIAATSVEPIVQDVCSTLADAT